MLELDIDQNLAIILAMIPRKSFLEAQESCERGFKAGRLLAYGRPAVEKSVNLTAKVNLYRIALKAVAKILQAASWSAQSPLLAGCVAVGMAGAAIVAAPGLATAPILSVMGFTAGGI